MKKFTLCAAFAVALSLAAAARASATPSCLGSLTDEDYQALQAGKGHYSREAVAALSGATAKNLCLARALVQKTQGQDPSSIEAQLTPNDIPVGLSKYTSPDEYAWVDPIAEQVLTNAIVGANFVSAR